MEMHIAKATEKKCKLWKGVHVTQHSMKGDTADNAVVSFKT
jgi:hypothetical protein